MNIHKNQKDMKYALRAVKYFVYIAIIFCIVVLILFYTSSHTADMTVFDLFKEGAWWKILVFLLAISAIYPIFGFATKEMYGDLDFAGKRDVIIKAMEQYNYVLCNQTPTSFTFRHKNMAIRIIRMMEDEVVIDFSSKPATISGLRKEVFRVGRLIANAAIAGESEN